MCLVAHNCSLWAQFDIDSWIMMSIDLMQVADGSLMPAQQWEHSLFALSALSVAWSPLCAAPSPNSTLTNAHSRPFAVLAMGMKDGSVCLWRYHTPDITPATTQQASADSFCLVRVGHKLKRGDMEAQGLNANTWMYTCAHGTACPTGWTHANWHAQRIDESACLIQMHVHLCVIFTAMV